MSPPDLELPHINGTLGMKCLLGESCCDQRSGVGLLQGVCQDGLGGKSLSQHIMLEDSLMRSLFVFLFYRLSSLSWWMNLRCFSMNMMERGGGGRDCPI